MKRTLVIVSLFLIIITVSSCATPFDYSDIYHVNFNFHYSDGNTQHRYEFAIVLHEQRGGFPPQYTFFGHYSRTPIIMSLLRHEFNENLNRYVERLDDESREVVYTETVRNIPPSDVAELRQILETHNISAWNGFSVPTSRDIHDSFFWLRAISRSGGEVSASAHVETPDGFDELFPVLVSFFDEMVQRHILQDMY